MGMFMMSAKIKYTLESMRNREEKKLNCNVFVRSILIRFLLFHFRLYLRMNQAGSDTRYVRSENGTRNINRRAHKVLCANSINKIINHEIVALPVCVCAFAGIQKMRIAE